MLAITFTLLFIYTIPLILIITIFIWSQFSNVSADAYELITQLSGIYLGTTRETIGTFLVPFVTAYAISDIQYENTELKKGTIIILYTMIIIFVFSIFAYSIIQIKLGTWMSNLDVTDINTLETMKNNLIDMSKSYLKETLAYISLLLGISHVKRSKGNE